tara:strand:- start:1818 stop:2291 length:474 start_codon:yes stop_codon:yes gene_type:complete
MATIIEPADLTVTITEAYSLKGVDYGNTMSKVYLSNGQVSQRVMSVYGGVDRTIFTNILALDTLDGQGQVVKLDYKYFRITNLDDTDTLNLRVFNGTEYFAFQVLPSSSFLLMDAGTDSPATSATVLAFSDITAIAGQSSNTVAATSIDVEFVMVTA